MSDTEPTAELIALGFSEHEAQIFVALSTLESAATAYELAKQTQVPVANAYNVIRSLEGRGACRKVLDNPARYVAVDTRDFLGRIADETTRRCNALIEKLEHMRPEAEARYVDVLQGQEAVRNRVKQMLDSASSLIVLKARTPLPGPLQSALERAILREVTCYVIYYGDAPELPTGDVHLWPHEGNGADMGKDFFTVTTDGVQSIAYDAHTYEAAFSENRVFVYMTDVLLRHEIYLAEILTEFGDEIETRFGPALHSIRENYAATPVSDVARQYIDQRALELGLKG